MSTRQSHDVNKQWASFRTLQLLPGLLRMCVERVLYGSMHWEWMVWQCFYPTIQQGVGIGIAVVAPCILLRLLVLYSGLKQTTLNILATVLGILILWWFYNTSLSYFLLLCALVYILLLVIPQRKGAAVSLFCVVFIFSWCARQLCLN